MNRLSFWLSIVAVVLALVALGLALLLPGPQGPKGDTGPQGIQGIQGPPSSLSVQRQVAHFTIEKEIGPVPSFEMTMDPCPIDLNAGDILQGYVSGTHGYWGYQVYISLHEPYYDSWLLGIGQGGTSFCYVAEATGRYFLTVSFADYMSFAESYPRSLPLSEDVPVVYWIQESA